MQKKEDYQTLAHAIIPYLPQDLIHYLDELIQSSKTYTYLKNNYAATSLNDILSSCLKTTMDENRNEQNYKSILVKLQTFRRVTKLRWLQSLEEELPGREKKKKNPLYITKEAKSFILLYAQKKELFKENVTLTKEEYIKNRYKEIKNWKENTRSLLIMFPYIKEKNVKTQVESFIKDLLLEAFYIISINFGGSLQGYITNIPSDFIEYPLFSLNQRTQMKTIEKDIVGGLYFDEYDTEQASVHINIDSDYVVKTMSASNKKITYKYKLLNAIDNQLLIYIYNLLNSNILYLNENKSLTISYKEIATQIFPGVKTLRKEHYRKIEDHLMNISAYHYEISFNDTVLNRKENLGINFFDTIHTKRNQSSSSSSIEITPTNYLKNIILNEKHISILTKKYKLIESGQTKMILAVLQTERISAFLQLEDKSLPITTTLPFSYFRSKFQIERLNTTRLKELISKCLEELQQKNIIISSYSYDKKSFHIQFTSFDALELRLYGLDRSNLFDGGNQEG